MESIDKIISQREYELLSNELMQLEAAQEFDGTDNSERIAEIKKLLDVGR